MDPDRSGLSRRRLLEVAAASAVVLTVGAVGTAAEPALATTTVPLATITAAAYVLARLHERGVDTLFGVPGATCDPLFAATVDGPVRAVVTSSDLEAGYAADGYARMKGLGAVSVTYGVGTLGLISVVAGAYAERCPVVVINGGPSADDLRLQAQLGTFFSHSIGKDKTDLAMFREVTAYAERAEKAEDVPRVVDAAIRAAVTQSRPVYIEIPKHLWTASCPAPAGPLEVAVPPSGQEDAIAAELVARLKAATRPAVLLGIEIQRYGLEDAVTALIERLGLPWATTFLAKSVVAEQTAGFVGVYGGSQAVPAVRHVIEDSDALLTLGCVWGRQYRGLVTGSAEALMQASQDQVKIGSGAARAAILGPLVAALQRQPWQADLARLAKTALPGLSFDQRRASITATPRSSGEAGLTYDEVLRVVSDGLDESQLVVTDTSLAMYPAADLNVAGRKGFVCNTVWQSIGYSVGASVGVALAQQRRPIVICGDGGFQMTAQSLSTMARHLLPVVVLVLDNGAYGIEQWLLEPAYFGSTTALPRPYLALNRWKYAELAQALGVASSWTVDSVAGLSAALAAAKTSAGPTLIAVAVQPHDRPTGLGQGA